MCGRFVTGADELTWAEYREMLTLSTKVDLLEERVCYPGSKVSVICKDPEEGGPGDQGISRKVLGAAEGEDQLDVEQGGVWKVALEKEDIEKEDIDKGDVGRGENKRILCEMSWGLKPSPKQRERGVGLIFNLRDDRIEKTYPELFHNRRCLIPASGFFEWKKLPSGKKQGFRISLADDPLFSFAGLWRGDQTGGGTQSLCECSLMTTSPNDQVAPIHDRMPVILLGDAANYWLNSDSDTKILQELLKPCHEELIISPMESTGGASQLSLF